MGVFTYDVCMCACVRGKRNVMKNPTKKTGRKSQKKNSKLTRERAPVTPSSRPPGRPSTGVVSVVLAVGYLALVQLMDSREMLPPPPEAMGMGDVR